jgi:RNA polymerase sigma-70 factor (ECF subfamily)
MTEQELVSRIREGDADAFAILLEQHQKKVYSLAFRMVRHGEDAADITQEVFLSAWKGMGSFHGDCALSTWLYRLTSNACIDFLRREKRKAAAGIHLSLDDTEEGETWNLPDFRGDPHRCLEEKQTREAIAAGMDALSQEHRTVLALREISGLSYAEIADVLDLEEGTVKSRIARARLALRKKLLESGNLSSVPSSE